ncbi:DUF1772 domain-containing protein [Streptomyces bauhiniae]|uniref:DUF1772 domain-containing protein n=1 Tax=Streptomyces bauhiniae TaxID=2340725 RepID=A0A4Z1D4M8_9ACTN|nr:DUF1772 domain-containing protein [Streptomyces bauhiniae]TGN76729.1 DUF1772 domain-containing protein [Streptomyces bauhiniae]
MLTALEVFTTVVAGLMVGVEFSVAFVINPILGGLPGDNGLRGRIHGARMLGAVMPFWYIGSLVLAAVWAVAEWGHQGAGLVVIAAGLLMLSVLMSILLLVPINNQTKEWTTDSLPEDWKEQAARWDRYHYVRVGILIGAFALLAAALA